MNTQFATYPSKSVTDWLDSSINSQDVPGLLIRSLVLMEVCIKVLRMSQNHTVLRYPLFRVSSLRMSLS